MAEMLNEAQARALAEDNLDNVFEELDEDALADGVQHSSGKVREKYWREGDGKVILMPSDRISTFDSVVGAVPFKGQVLDDITHWWFERTQDIIDNYVTDRPSRIITVGKMCDPVMVEMVVRGYLTGSSDTSILPEYARGKRMFCGHTLPNGMKPHEKLPSNIVTPTTKAPKGKNDENISAEEVLRRGLVPGIDDKNIHGRWSYMHDKALEVFGRGQHIAGMAGLILVDTKYEMGMTPGGMIVLIDEVNTPDSSRYWIRENYLDRFEQGQSPQSMSKEFGRERVIAKGYDPKTDKGKPVPKLDDEDRVECAVRYIMLCQQITSQPFKPDKRPVEERVYRPLEELGVMRR